MEILFDLRIPNTNSHALWYATEWLLAYKESYSDATLSYIGYERTLYDVRLDAIDHVLLPLEKGWYQNWKNRSYLSKFQKGEMIFSFSEKSIHVRSIPVIRDISGIVELLSDNSKETVDTHAIYIVHTLSKKQELIERFGLDENHIHLLPLWIPKTKPEEQPITSDRLFFENGLHGNYILHDMGWQEDAQIDKLLTFWKNHSPKYQLVLLGEMKDAYEKYRDIIRSEGLLESVKIIGLLPEDNIDTLYRRASGWIYIGYHYSGQSSLFRAISHDLPLILSDLDDFRDLGALKINPRRLALESTLMDRLDSGESSSMYHETSLDPYDSLFRENLKNTNK